MADSKKYNGSTWQHSLRKLTTATEAVENPLYSDGTAITAYTIKGNTVQNGTPTPSNPVEVNGVGVRTENLFDGQWQQGYYAYLTGDYSVGGNYVCTHLIPCTENTTYTFKCISMAGGSKNYGYVFFDSAQSMIGSDYIKVQTEGDVVTHTATTPQNTAFLAINIAYGRRQVPVVHPSDITNFMLNTGSTAKPYEPYGYKIPILSNGVTTNIYLGSTQSTRQIEKITFDGSDDEGWYLERINSYGIANFGLSNAIRSLRTGLNWLSNRFVPQSSLIAQTETEGILLNTRLACFIRIDSTTVSTPTAFKQWLSENPVDVWYVLATPQTAAVNEPLMKIGDYADTLSNAASIPTTEGANSITVDTTVQPSEFTATWTGWHDSSVKEWDGSQWE